MDRLSDILDFIEVRSAVSGGSIMSGRWQTTSVVDDDLKFIAIVTGHARLQTNDVDGVAELGPGDVAVLNGRTWLKIDGGEGDAEPVQVDPPTAGTPLTDVQLHADADALIGGRIELDPIGRELVLHAIPPLLHARAGSTAEPRLLDHVRQLFNELVSDRLGSEFAVRHHGQLLVLEIIRGLPNDPELPAGWLTALTNESLRPALTLMHEHPGHGWQLERLAQAASMSRTTFAERFRRAAGVPPLTYLHNWRMLIAQRTLRHTDTSIQTLAHNIGYQSESSFSSAFKRHVGESPRTYRSRVSSARPTGSQKAASSNSIAARSVDSATVRSELSFGRIVLANQRAEATLPS